MASSRLLKIVFISAFISYAFVHPFVMVISSAMNTSDIVGHHHKADLGLIFLESFSVSMLPWSLGFAIFGGIVGYFYYKNRQSDAAKTKLLYELQEAFFEIKRLSGFLSICCVCKQIKNENGKWKPIEIHVSENSDATFSHTYCPDCAQKALDKYLEDNYRD